MRFSAATLCLLMLAAPVAAESFDVSLGGKALGKLKYAETGRKAVLTSTLDNTPLGVFNGKYTGTSIGNTATSHFTGESRSSRKNRVVTVEIAKSRAVSTAITPQDELTALSDINKVPAGVMDPVRAMAQLFRAKGCPAPIRMYDGRRVVAMRSDSGTLAGETLTCAVSYKVIAGPGHLSPLGISSAKIELNYRTAGGQQTLQHLKISSGLFNVRLSREN